MTATVEHIRKQIDAEVETAWDVEIDARLQDVEQGRVRLLTAEESDERTEKLFTRLGIKRPVHRP